MTPKFFSLFRRDQMSVDALYAALDSRIGLLELSIGLGCVLLGLWCGRAVYRRYFQQHPVRYDRFLPYLAWRMVLPASAFLLLLAAILFSSLMLDNRPHILLALAAMMFWLGVIRLLLALLRESLPRGRVERHTENLVSVMLWAGFVTWAIDLDGLVFDWMDSVSFSIGKIRLDLSTIVSGIFWVTVILLLALWVSRALEKRLMALSELDLNLRTVFSKLARIGLMVMAVLIALQVVGIDLTVLSVFGATLGVGLGFGLQKIASNYISGFIILLDRSIRIGDRLMVNDRVGYVTQITARYVVLKGMDGSEALIPNDTMIVNMVINQSYTDKRIWTSVRVGVAYGTDLELALRLLVQAAKHPRIQPDPGPTGYVTGFGDSSIGMELGFWVLDPENGFLGLKSDINLAIWRLFAQNGIQMPFPQSEVRLLNPQLNVNLPNQSTTEMAGRVGEHTP